MMHAPFFSFPPIFEHYSPSHSVFCWFSIPEHAGMYTAACILCLKHLKMACANMDFFVPHITPDRYYVPNLENYFPENKVQFEFSEKRSLSYRSFQN